MKIKGLSSLVLSVLIYMNVYGQTELSGIISKDTTLVKSKSPFTLTGFLTVRNNAKLTIENGCTVNFGNYNILIGSSSPGYIIASNVAFSTSASTDRNIDFKNGGQANISNCSFNKVYVRIEDDAGSTLSFTGNNFSNVTLPFKISPNTSPVISGNSCNVSLIGLQGTVNHTKTLSRLQWNYELTGVVYIQNNAVLTVDDNVVTDLKNYAFYVGYSTPGALNANHVTFNCSYQTRGELTFRDGGYGNITNSGFNHLMAVIESDAGNNLSFTGNTFTNVDYPFELDINRQPVISGNSGTVKRISLKGTVNDNVTLKKYEWDYTLGSNIYINKSKTLTITGGINIDFYRYFISVGSTSAGMLALSGCSLNSTYTNGGYVYFRDGGTGTVSTNNFSNVYIKIEENAANNISITNNKFTNINYPVELSAGKSLSITGNTSSVRLIGLYGSVSANSVLPRYQWDYKLAESITIRSNAALTIADSVKIDLGTKYINVGAGSTSTGTLNASKAYFKGTPDDRGRINFNISSGGNLNHCSFDQTYIKIDNCTPAFQNCRFYHSGTAIEVKNSANPAINFSDFYNNELSVKNTGTVQINATNNYWGHASGPQIANNPTGIGEIVEGNINCIPFKVQPNTGVVNDIVSPTDFRLGMISTGVKTDTSFTVTNNGDLDLLISGIHTNTSGISVKSYDRFWLNADSVMVINFSYTPLESGARTDTIFISTNNTSHPDQQLLVSTIGHIDSLNINFNKMNIDSFPLVKCYFTVTDQANIPIGDILKSNIILKEDGKAITDFQFITKKDVSSPVAAVLVIDQSGSMQGQKLRDAKSSAIDFVNELAPNDIASVISFNDEVRVRKIFTSDKAGLIKSINGISPTGETAIFDAIARAVDSVKYKPGNKAIIALTDGLDNSSSVMPEAIVAMALQYGISVYTIGLGEDAEASTIEYISSSSGGQYYYAPNSEILSIIYKRISGQLQNQYLIAYNAPINNPFPRTIQLTVNYLALTVTDSIKYTTQKQLIEFMPGTIPFKLDEFNKNSRSYFYYKIKNLNNILSTGEEIRFINKSGTAYIPFGGTYLGKNIFQFWVDLTRNLSKTHLLVSLPDSLIHNGSWIKFINKPSSFDIQLNNFPSSQNIDVFASETLGVSVIAGGVGAGPSIAAASLSVRGTGGMGLNFEMNTDKKEYITRRFEAGVGLKAESPAINGVVGHIQSGVEANVMVKGILGQTMLFPSVMDDNATKAKTLFLLETFSLGALSLSPDCSVLKTALHKSLSLLDHGMIGAYNSFYYSNLYGVNIEGKASLGFSVASGSGADQNKLKLAEVGGKMVFSGQFLTYPQTSNKTISFGYALEGGFSVLNLNVMGVDIGNLAGYTAGIDFNLGANFTPSAGFHSLDLSMGLNQSFQVVFGQKHLSRELSFNVPKKVIARALSNENIIRGVNPFFSTSAPKMDFTIGKDYFLNSISNMFSYTTGTLDSLNDHIVIETSEAEANCIQIDASAKIDAALIAGGGLELGVTLSYADEISKLINQNTIVDGKLLPLAKYNASSSASLFNLKDEIVSLLKNAPLLVLDLIKSLISVVGEEIKDGIDYTLKTVDGTCTLAGNIAGGAGTFISGGLSEIASYSPSLSFMNSLKSSFRDPEIINGYMSSKVKKSSDEKTETTLQSNGTLYLISNCYRVNIYNDNKEIIPEFDPCILTVAINSKMFKEYGFEEADKNKANIYYYDFASLTWIEIPGDLNQHPDTVAAEIGKSGTYAAGLLYNPVNDKNAPEIRDHYPANGGIFEPDSVLWAKLYEPPLGAGIDLSKSSISIDGKETDILWDPINGIIFFRPVNPLPKGQHTMKITAFDHNNNMAVEDVIFTVNKTTGTNEINKQAIMMNLYPNPLAKRLTIELGNCNEGNLEVAIYNNLGQKIKLLFAERINGASQTLTWDRTNDSGNQVSSGLYFVRVKNEGNIFVKKVVVN